MVVHIRQISDQLFILNRRSEGSSDSRLSQHADADFQTRLPEKRQLLQFHTEEERYLDEAADQFVIQIPEIIMINHRRGIGLHPVLERKLAVLPVGEAHDRVIEIELCAYGHKELFVTELVSQPESSSHEAVVFVQESRGVQTLRHRSGIVDTGREEVAVSHPAPETEPVSDVPIEISEHALVLLLYRRHLCQILLFLLRRTHFGLAL